MLLKKVKCAAQLSCFLSTEGSGSVEQEASCLTVASSEEESRQAAESQLIRDSPKSHVADSTAGAPSSPAAGEMEGHPGPEKEEEEEKKVEEVEVEVGKAPVQDGEVTKEETSEERPVVEAARKSPPRPPTSPTGSQEAEPVAMDTERVGPSEPAEAMQEGASALSDDQAVLTPSLHVEDRPTQSEEDEEVLDEEDEEALAESSAREEECHTALVGTGEEDDEDEEEEVVRRVKRKRRVDPLEGGCKPEELLLDEASNMSHGDESSSAYLGSPSEHDPHGHCSGADLSLVPAGRSRSDSLLTETDDSLPFDPLKPDGEKVRRRGSPGRSRIRQVRATHLSSTQGAAQHLMGFFGSNCP